MSSATDINITRVLDAPVATVWRVWTEPEYFARWFGASPESVSLEVRDGGAWSATLETPAGEFRIGGVYQEVVEHKRLVWTVDLPQGATVMTASFTDLGEKTEVHLHQPASSEEQRQQAEQGSLQLLDSFATVLATV
ncbi:activator of HSP90 ATPase [Wenjunlia vitaminophila]|uniref:Activator of HSP90 ATPase n=1 Tax=Wenjunlia vitaminophila TaxID=76728 RepID=A0A0T6LSL3_WENVI|nr:SRPBCC domain-containing protein [Wenjunlia vitaminophila]KRV49118.1 activator of HSP90 ATPase [Wenjunlia vitaminophila]